MSARVLGRKLPVSLDEFERRCLARLSQLEQEKCTDRTSIELLAQAVELCRQSADTVEATLQLVADALCRRSGAQLSDRIK